MRVKIEIVNGLPETEVLIRCGQLDESVILLQDHITKQGSSKRCLPLKRGDTEYYVPINQKYLPIPRSSCSDALTSCMSWKNCCREDLCEYQSQP